MDRVDICNFALAKCGEQRIVSLNDKSKNAILCNLHFEQTLQEVLRNHPWNCAIKRASLAEYTDTPAFGFDHQYYLPEDCLRILWMEEDTAVFRIESGMLLTDENPANVIYIRNVTDMNDLDPLCVKVVMLELAIKLSYNLTETRTQTEALLAEAERAWIEARAMDAHEGTPKVVEFSEWLNARRTGPSIYRGETSSYRDITPVTP